MAVHVLCLSFVLVASSFHFVVSNPLCSLPQFRQICQGHGSQAQGFRSQRPQQQFPFSPSPTFPPQQQTQSNFQFQSRETAPDPMSLLRLSQKIPMRTFGSGNGIDLRNVLSTLNRRQGGSQSPNRPQLMVERTQVPVYQTDRSLGAGSRGPSQRNFMELLASMRQSQSQFPEQRLPQQQQGFGGELTSSEWRQGGNNPFMQRGNQLRSSQSNFAGLFGSMGLGNQRNPNGNDLVMPTADPLGFANGQGSNINVFPSEAPSRDFLNRNQQSSLQTNFAGFVGSGGAGNQQVVQTSSTNQDLLNRLREEQKKLEIQKEILQAQQAQDQLKKDLIEQQKRRQDLELQAAQQRLETEQQINDAKNEALRQMIIRDFCDDMGGPYQATGSGCSTNKGCKTGQCCDYLTRKCQMMPPPQTAFFSEPNAVAPAQQSPEPAQQSPHPVQGAPSEPAGPQPVQESGFGANHAEHNPGIDWQNPSANEAPVNPWV